MFFSGDAASRRKVELRGRSSKESDRQAVLNKARDEREQRLRARQRQQSALRIQKCFRGRREVKRNQVLIRQGFIQDFGERSDKAHRGVFKPDSQYLPRLLYFCSRNTQEDLLYLTGACRHFGRCLNETKGDVLAVITSGDYGSQRGAVNYRVNRFTTLCLRALHSHRESFKEELISPGNFTSDTAVLVETILTLSGADLPWAGSVIDHLARNKLFHLLRDLLLTVQLNDPADRSGTMSSLERLVYQLSLHYIQRAKFLKQMPFSWGLPPQIFSVPLLWQRIPLLKQVSATEGLWAYVIHQTAINLQDLKSSLPPDITHFPSAVCFIGNTLEVARLALSQPNCSIQLVTDFANVARCLMSSIPCSYYRIKPEVHDEDDDDEMKIDDDESLICIPQSSLVEQLNYASSHGFLKDMIRVAFSRIPVTSTAASTILDREDTAAVAAVCGFLYATFSVLDKSSVISGLAYGANLVPPLWRYILSCQLNNNWLPIELNSPDSQLTPELLGWMLPLAVFCPVFSHLLFSMDNDEFYNMEYPMKIDDVVQLVLILKEGLWQMLWVLPWKKSRDNPADIFMFQTLRQFFIKVTSSLLAELHDRNSKRDFAPSHIFHARETIEESFFHQAEGENTKARDLLNTAPFLIPFTSRVRVYTAQLAAARENDTSHHHHSRLRIRVQRDRIVEDGFAQVSGVPREALRETMRVNYVNELGVEEAGVDGGGLFKDFMENITKAAFDIQYGLFKETADHLLYPNPASHLVHDNHLQYFEFLGKILGKAMFEGILVDIPFAAFFLRKLCRKHNYLHDLPSLDPELYKNLLYLKSNPNMVSQLDLYFVIEDNDYGEQSEVELLPGGKDIQVTNESVFKYIHLVANHRLNHQIRQQSSHFLEGFQLLISSEWINMFNEHELQTLISGSRDGMDIDDLRENTNYGGGYHETHPVIQMFWEILKMLDSDLQRKFLKFVTGCSRGPLLGFKYLEPLFCIQKTSPEDAEEVLDRLPTSATCMNLLKLPPYKSKEMIRDKLVYAITAGAGFDLS